MGGSCLFTNSTLIYTLETMIVSSSLISSHPKAGNEAISGAWELDYNMPLVCIVQLAPNAHFVFDPVLFENFTSKKVWDLIIAPVARFWD